MKRDGRFYLLGLAFIFVLSGCVVRTYPLTRERVDQDLEIGNRGYLQGESSAGEEIERKATRTTQMVEIEFHSPIRFERMPKAGRVEEEAKEEAEEITSDTDIGILGNRGYISMRNIPEAKKSVPVVTVEKYTVQKGDTLQKISKKFYGTTKKWQKIYEANQDTLKGPNKIYPGQIIDVPLDPEEGQGAEALMETEENLK
ncbi:MAG: LysM peptidoglycan-binding domain-containing protein [Candidatus Omnitrophota bacterium]